MIKLLGLDVAVAEVVVVVALAVARQLQALVRRDGPHVANGDGAAVSLSQYVSFPSILWNMQLTWPDIRSKIQSMLKPGRL